MGCCACYWFSNYVLQISGSSAPPALLDQALDTLEAALTSIETNGERERATQRMRSLLAKLSAKPQDRGPATADQIQAATSDELFELLDRELD